VKYQKLFDYTVSSRKSFNQSSSVGISEQMYLWKLCIVIIGLVSVLSFAAPAMAGYEMDGSPATLSQEQTLFNLEMFDGEHLSIPNKTIAAKIDYNNDAALLGGITLENVVVTAIVPTSGYFNAAKSHGDWACDNDGEEGDSCHLKIGTIQAGQSGSLRFATTMYASNITPEEFDQITTMEASLHADNMPASAIDLFQSDIILGMSAPTALEFAQEPAISESVVEDMVHESSDEFHIFLPVVMSWQ